MPGKTSKLKERSGIFHNIENAKGKMLEASPNLERNTTICHGTAKKLTLCVSYMMRRREALFKGLLISS